MSSFFSPQVSAKDRVRDWTNNLKKEQRQLNRDMDKVKREGDRVKLELKKEAKKGNTKACRILAKSVIQSQKTCEKLLVAQTQINSVILQLKTNMAVLNVSGQMKKSTEIMQSMSKLISMPAVRNVATAMSKEMMKAGIIEEMVDDAFSMTEDTDLETEADAEVEKVLFQITEGTLGQIGNLKDRPKEKDEVVDADDSKEIDEMKARLSALDS